MGFILQPVDRFACSNGIMRAPGRPAPELNAIVA